MDSKHWMQVEELLHHVLQLEPSQRSAFLAGVSDAAVRAEVQSLLNADLQGDATVELAIGAAAAAAVTVTASHTGIAEEEFGGRYRIVRVIGEGGMGTVYLAEQRIPVRRNVALKLIRPGMDNEQVLARFEVERQALAMMDHPNIARVLDAGATAGGRPYFVMELVEGIPITDYCDAHNLRLRERLELFRPVCQAVQHAHQKGIIHRDIKPSNILVATYDSKPVPKVIDFGLAKATEQTLTDRSAFTHFGTIVGTVQYMSPEQAHSGALVMDTRSDIYSLGSVLYELLTGTTPLTPEQLNKAAYAEVLRCIVEDEPPPPSVRFGSLTETPIQVSGRRRTERGRLAKALAGDLDWIVMKALAKEPARRYATANALLRDLERYIAGEPVEAGPPSAVYRIRKFANRHRGLLISTFSAVVLLLVFASVSTWQAVQVKHERDRAMAALREANAGRLAAHAMGSLTENPERSISLALHAVAATLQFRQPVLPAAANALHSAILTSAVRRSLQGHADRVTDVAVSPDGTRIATASEDKTAKIWDVSTGREVLTLTGHQDWVWSVAYSPDGRQIATGGPDKTARIWDAVTGQPVRTMLGHEHSIREVSFGPDGKYLATAGSDRTARLWEVATGRLLHTFRHEDVVLWVGFTPDSRQLITTSGTRTAKIWDIRSGRSRHTFRIGKPAAITAFSVDRRRLAFLSLTRPGRVDTTLSDVETGRELLVIRGHDGQLANAEFSQDGTRILTGDRNGVLQLWDSTTGEELVTLRGNGAPIGPIAFGPGSTTLVTASGRIATVWDLAPGGEEPALRGPARPVFSIAFSPTGRQLASMSIDGRAVVWDAVTGRELITLPGGLSASFDKDGRRIVRGLRDKTAVVSDAVTGQELVTYRGHRDSVWSATFTPDGQRVVSGSTDMTAQVWHAGTGKELRTLRGHKGFVWTVAVSPDGQQIATGASDSTARLWDALSGRELFKMNAHKSQVRNVAFSPDGKRLATASEDRTIKIWDTGTGKELLTLQGHEGPVMSVSFSPDGKQISSASLDKTARVWDADTGQELFTLRARTPKSDYSVAFHPDGKRLAVGDEEGVVHMYIVDIHELIKLAKTRITRPLTLTECRTFLGADTCPPLP